MTVALASLISGRPVRNDVAMTGEVTLTGQVLPIGGLKEKSLAAQRAGIKRVIVPERNEGDVEEIPEHERGDLEFVYVDEVSEAIDAALDLRPMEAAGALGRGRPGGFARGDRARRSRAALARLLDRRRADRCSRRRCASRPSACRPTTTTRSSPPAASCAAASGTRWTRSASASRRRRSTTRSPGSGRRSTGTGEFGLRSLSALAGVATVPVAYLLGAELRGRRAGIARRGAGRGQPDAALVLAGGARLLAAVLLSALSLLYFVRALERGGRRDFALAGASPRPRPRDPLLRRLPDRRRGALAAAPARAAAALAGLGDRRRRRRSLLAPLAIHQMSLRPRRWIGNFSLGHRLWEIGGDLRRRRDRRHHRPARAARCWRSCRWR